MGMLTNEPNSGTRGADNSVLAAHGGLWFVKAIRTTLCANFELLLVVGPWREGVLSIKKV